MVCFHQFERQACTRWFKYENAAKSHEIFDCVHESKSKIIVLVYFYVNDVPNTKGIKTTY